MTLELKHDLKADLDALMRTKLQSIGVDPNGNSDLVLTYLHCLRKKPNATPRRVFRSDELEKSCTVEILTRANELLNKVETGHDISGYLSKDASKGHKPDGLLTDWAVHHLHLVDKNDPNHLKDTGDLLFARITDDSLYAITVLPHGCWSEMEVIEALKRNWPHLIKTVNQGVTTEEQGSKIRELNNELRRTSQEHQILRDANVNGMVVTSDGSLTIPGTFMTTSGHSVVDAMQRNHVNRFMRFIEQMISEQLPALIQRATKGDPATVNVKLIDLDLFTFSYAYFELDSTYQCRLTWPIIEGKNVLRLEILPQA